MEIKIDWNKVYEYMIPRIENELKRRCPVHDGHLKKSIKGRIEGDDLKFYMASYWYYVENGSAPHWTSVKNLEKWCEDKWGDAKLAYALQHHIAKHGTKPTHFIKETLIQEFPRILADALKQKDVVYIK